MRFMRQIDQAEEFLTGSIGLLSVTSMVSEDGPIP